MRFLLFLCVIFVLAACKTTSPEASRDAALTVRTVGPAYADALLDIADANKDGKITLVEWTSAGGEKRNFLLIDQNKDRVLTRSELVRISSNVKFLDMAQRNFDFNHDHRLTRRELQTVPGIRVLRIEF